MDAAQHPLVFDIGTLLRKENAPRLSASLEIADLSWVPEAELAGTLRVDVAIDRVSGGLAVTLAHMAGKVRERCARCLTPLEHSFSLARATRLFSFDPAADFTDTEERPEGLDVSRQILDLRPFAREELLLGIEGTRHCREDCKGLCPTCGADLNVAHCDCPDPGAAQGPLSSLGELWGQRTASEPQSDDRSS